MGYFTPLPDSSLPRDTDPRVLAFQGFIMYAVGMALIILRWFLQIFYRSKTNIQPDDFVMLFVAACFTVLTFTLIRSVSGTGGNGFTAEEVAQFTPEEKMAHVQTAILVQVSEQFMLVTIYSVKACMLMIYYRMTANLREQKWVCMLMIYTTIGYIATEVSMFSLCRPYDQYWALPPNDINQCAFYRKYSIPQGVFNVSSECLLLMIPLPLLARASLPKRQKIPLLGIFGLGMYVIAAGILSKSYALLPENRADIVYAFWYLREASVAIYVANLPSIYTHVRRMYNELADAKGWHKRRNQSTSSSDYSEDPKGVRTILKARNARIRASRRLADEEDLWDTAVEDNYPRRKVNEDVIVKNQTYDVQVTDDTGSRKCTTWDGRNEGKNAYTVEVAAPGSAYTTQH